MDKKSWEAGVRASMAFLRHIGQDTIAEDMERFVLPGRNWRKRLADAVIEASIRWDEGMERRRQWEKLGKPEEADSG